MLLNWVAAYVATHKTITSVTAGRWSGLLFQSLHKYVYIVDGRWCDSLFPYFNNFKHLNLRFHH